MIDPLSTPTSLRTVADVPVLKVRGLKRSFGNFTAVDGLDLNVFGGEIYGFLGVNGAGKTTTLRLLMGILTADDGTISILGETTRRTSVSQKRRIGYVSQEQYFYPWMTCRALGRFVGSMYPTWDPAEFSRLLGIFQIPEQRRSSELSGGMRAKLALALALAPRPALLILDEPTAGLDPVARREFMEIIVAQSRQHGRTTLFSSHLIEEVERCADRVGVIHQGRMRFEGGLTELREQVVRIRVPCGLQMELSGAVEVWREEESGGLRTLTLKADPAVRAGWVLPSDAEWVPMSLEDIFIACVGARKVEV